MFGAWTARRFVRLAARAAVATPGQAHESKSFEDSVNAVRIPPVIPQRSDQVGRIGGHRGFDKGKDPRRKVVERCVTWLKECRRVATRFEQLAVNYPATIDLVIVPRLRRVAVS
ncbi:MAG: hypothetical protein D6731_00990 [Planctomycetota bacterium]|nr:MAG: hypothetical protein D6731_00990 [Planctomycetota bacterium]